MKKYIKNITDDKSILAPNGKPYEPTTLSFNEKGQRYILAPGETKETKLNGENVDGKRLRFFSDKKKKEDKK